MKYTCLFYLEWNACAQCSALEDKCFRQGNEGNGRLDVVEAELKQISVGGFIIFIST